jgi:hypothetical protein
MEADDHTRRLLNQAFFENLYVDDEPRADLAEPFRTLFGPEVLSSAGFMGGGRVHVGDRAKTTVVAGRPNAPGWSIEQVRMMREPASRTVRDNQPSRTAAPREGSKENYLVPPAGFEPALSLV